VAASSTLIAVSHATVVVARVLVFDLGGTLVAMFGGAALSEADSCCAGLQLGLPSSLAVCGLSTTAAPVLDVATDLRRLHFRVEMSDWED
jgi:hypothetical protein